MKRKSFFSRSLFAFIFLALACTGFKGNAQGITTYQYRYVAPDKTAEFISRETTYWSKVAKNAIDKGNLTFWGLFEKVGGFSDPNTPNYLFVNTFNDLDGNLNDIFNAAASFPNVPLTKMETNSISTTLGTVFISSKGWTQAEKVDPEKDFKYVVMNYHNSTDPNSFVALENKYWAPFIKSAMDNDQTQQVAWGNSIVLSPIGGNMKWNCLSVDIFKNLTSALTQPWSPNVQFPTVGLDSLNKLSINSPATVIYRTVMVVSKN